MAGRDVLNSDAFLVMSGKLVNAGTA